MPFCVAVAAASFAVYVKTAELCRSLMSPLLLFTFFLVNYGVVLVVYSINPEHPDEHKYERLLKSAMDRSKQHGTRI